MKRRTITFLKVALFLVGVVTLSLCVFVLPSLANDSANRFSEYAYLKYPVLFGLYFTAIPFFYALYQALKLLRYIDKNNAFSDLAVQTLKRIKHSATAVIILYVIGMIILFSQNALHP